MSALPFGAPRLIVEPAFFLPECVFWPEGSFYSLVILARGIYPCCPVNLQ